MNFENGYRIIAFFRPTDPTQMHTITYHADITAPSGRIYEIEKVQTADVSHSEITLNILSEGEKVPVISRHGCFHTVNDAIDRIYEEETLITEKENMETKEIIQETKETEEPDLEPEYY